LKKKITIIGNVITIVTLGYIVTLLPSIEFKNLNISFFSMSNIFLILPLLYILLVALMSYAWRTILLNSNKSPINILQPFIVYAITGIYKYLPGNIFHYVGRQFFSKSLNRTQKEIAKSSIVETLLLFLTLMLLTIPVIIFIPFPQEYLTYLDFTFSKKYLLMILCFGIFIFYFIFKKKIPRITHLVFMYVSVFLLHSAILCVLFFLQNNSPVTTDTIFFIIGISIGSWALGYITPGSPGGIGIREAVIMYLLSISLTTLDNALLIALLFRIVTILGDIYTYFLGKLLENKNHMIMEKRKIYG